MSQSVIQLVEFGLIQEGLDGLYSPDCCACKIGDLSPADCLSGTCIGGKLHKHSKDESLYVIGKPGVSFSDEDIERMAT
jgi:hypothetical protein